MNARADGDAVVAHEVAEQEFERFVEAMDLDFDMKGMDDDDRKSFLEAKKKIVRAMVEGALVIDQSGQPVFTPRMGENKSPITFYEPTGASFMAMDQKKAGHTTGKMFAAMSDMTRENAKRFSQMSNRDLNVCMAIATLFFG